MIKSRTMIEIQPIVNLKRTQTASSRISSGSSDNFQYLPDINQKSSKEADHDELIQYSLEVRDKLNLIKQDKINLNYKSSSFKTISRFKEPIITETMNVDKWIEIHKRRNKRAALGLIAQNMEQEEALELFEKYSITNKNLINELIDKDKSKQTRTISIRQLRNLTLLDKVHERLRLELEETVKKVRKLEAQREFNSIVDRIRYFIDEVEEFQLTSDSNNKLVKNDKISKIKLYEYD